MSDEPRMNEKGVVERLLDASNGHPHAKIPWPHRLLHDAVAEIERLEHENTKLVIGQRAAELRLKAYELFYGIMSDHSELNILSGKGDAMLTEREWEKATKHRRRRLEELEK